jgi:lipopolysaccharide heptosyltransferase II
LGTRFFEKSLHIILKSRARKRSLRPFDLSAIAGINRILLMTTTAIGDTLFSTPAIRAVKETYPDKKVHVLSHVRNQLLLIENPFIDRLLLYQGKRKGIIKLIRELREGHYDLVVILHSNDPEAVPLARATQAPHIIGPGTSRFADFLSDKILCTDESRHAIERRLDYVRIIGADTVNKKMDLFLPAQSEKNAVRILKAKWKDGLRPLIGLHPTGSGSYKWWPKEYFATLAQALINRHRARLVIFSSRQEAAVARFIAENLGEDVLLAEGRYDLLDVAALMQKCRLFVANDSGLLHVALALGIPTLALIGADSPLRIGPYQVSNSACLYKKEGVCQEIRCLNQGCQDNRCLKAISPEEVLAVIENRFRESLLNPDDPKGRYEGKKLFPPNVEP